MHPFKFLFLGHVFDFQNAFLWTPTGSWALGQNPHVCIMFCYGEVCFSKKWSSGIVFCVRRLLTAWVVWGNGWCLEEVKNLLPPIYLNAYGGWVAPGLKGGTGPQGVLGCPWWSVGVWLYINEYDDGPDRRRLHDTSGVQWGVDAGRPDLDRRRWRWWCSDFSHGALEHQCGRSIVILEADKSLRGCRNLRTCERCKWDRLAEPHRHGVKSVIGTHFSQWYDTTAHGSQ